MSLVPHVMFAPPGIDSDSSDEGVSPITSPSPSPTRAKFSFKSLFIESKSGSSPPPPTSTVDAPGEAKSSTAIPPSATTDDRAPQTHLQRLKRRVRILAKGDTRPTTNKGDAADAELPDIQEGPEITDQEEAADPAAERMLTLLRQLVAQQQITSTQTPVERVPVDVKQLPSRPPIPTSLPPTPTPSSKHRPTMRPSLALATRHSLRLPTATAPGHTRPDTQPPAMSPPIAIDTHSGPEVTPGLNVTYYHPERYAKGDDAQSNEMSQTANETYHRPLSQPAHGYGVGPYPQRGDPYNDQLSAQQSGHPPSIPPFSAPPWQSAHHPASQPSHTDQYAPWASYNPPSYYHPPPMYPHPSALQPWHPSQQYRGLQASIGWQPPQQTFTSPSNYDSAPYLFQYDPRSAARDPYYDSRYTTGWQSPGLNYPHVRSEELHRRPHQVPGSPLPNPWQDGDSGDPPAVSRDSDKTAAQERIRASGSFKARGGEMEVGLKQAAAANGKFDMPVSAEDGKPTSATDKPCFPREGQSRNSGKMPISNGADEGMKQPAAANYRSNKPVSAADSKPTSAINRPLPRRQQSRDSRKTSMSKDESRPRQREAVRSQNLSGRSKRTFDEPFAGMLTRPVDGEGSASHRPKSKLSENTTPEWTAAVISLVRCIHIGHSAFQRTTSAHTTHDGTQGELAMRIFLNLGKILAGGKDMPSAFDDVFGEDCGGEDFARELDIVAAFVSHSALFNQATPSKEGDSRKDGILHLFLSSDIFRKILEDWPLGAYITPGVITIIRDIATRWRNGDLSLKFVLRSVLTIRKELEHPTASPQPKTGLLDKLAVVLSKQLKHQSGDTIIPVAAAAPPPTSDRASHTRPSVTTTPKTIPPRLEPPHPPPVADDSSDSAYSDTSVPASPGTMESDDEADRLLAVADSGPPARPIEDGGERKHRPGRGQVKAAKDALMRR